MHRQFFDKKFIMYLISGMIAFTSEYLSFAALETFMRLGVNLSHSVSFCLGVIISFSLNYLWVFRTQEYEIEIKSQIGLYLLLAVINLLITNLLIFRLTAMAISPLISKLIVMVFIVVWNFLIFRHIIFKSKTSV